MEINIADLHQVFNTNFVEEKNGNVTIQERQKKATLTEFSFTHPKFLNFDSNNIDKINRIFEKKSKNDTLFACGCDGIFLVLENETWYLFLVEIKSSAKKIPKALKQIQLTYSKFLNLLNFIESIDISQFHPVGIVVTPPKEDTAPKDKNKLMKKAMISKIGKQASQIFYLAKSTIKKEDSILKDVRIKEQFKFESLPVFHVNSELEQVNFTAYLN
jgi:hypothetical protein